MHVVAIDVDPALDSSTVASVRTGAYEPSDLHGKRLVITATGVSDIDATVAADATERGVWVNAADQTDDCSFILPAVARVDDLAVAVSSDGTAPSVVSWLRDRIRQEILDAETRTIAVEIAASPPDPCRRRLHRGHRLAGGDRSVASPLMLRPPHLLARLGADLLSS